MNRIMFHIDVNSAFLSWEAVYCLKHKGGSVDLWEEVSAVGGGIAMQHGIILAKSIPAKKYKIQTGEPVTDLFFGGVATTKKLLNYGIRSIGE